MYCAKLQQYTNFLKGDNRRHSFYGLKDQACGQPSISLENVLAGGNKIHEQRKGNSKIFKDTLKSSLVRSPSDSSLMYLNQLVAASNGNTEYNTSTKNPSMLYKPTGT